MPEKKTAINTVSVGAGKIQQSISDQLHTALSALKEQIGEKKFEKRIHKAVKMLVKGIKKGSLDKTSKPAKKKTAQPATIRQEDIAFRAYLIGEKRQQLGLPGDSLGDWVEAERQLLGEFATHGVD